MADVWEVYTMVFTLSSGEERIASHLDYNAFFALRVIDKANKKMQKAFRQWNSSKEIQSPELVTYFYNNGVRIGFFDALKKDEVVVSAFYV